MTQKEKCLITDCDKLEISRGLCTRHYQHAQQYVRRAQVTWEELIAGGMAKDANYHQGWTRKNQFNKMFEKNIGKLREKILP